MTVSQARVEALAPRCLFSEVTDGHRKWRGREEGGGVRVDLCCLGQAAVYLCDPPLEAVQGTHTGVQELNNVPSGTELHFKRPEIHIEAKVSRFR